MSFATEPFEDLIVSTVTVMAYSNLILDTRKLFQNIEVLDTTGMELYLSKKKKLPSIKKIDAPYGSVLSMRSGNNFRGLVNKNMDDVKNNTHFLNQFTCIISLGNKVNINVFVFRTSFKIVGCKNESIAQEVISILWDKYIKELDDCYTICDEECPTFVFETVMSNIDFLLGFNIDRCNLNTLLNEEKYSKKIITSNFDPTLDTNVNIQLFTSPPDDYFYWSMKDEEVGWVYDKVNEIKYRKAKKKLKKTTFLVFQSSKIIMSARYAPRMKRDYDYFISIIKENKELIEETKIDPLKSPFNWDGFNELLPITNFSNYIKNVLIN